jgi:hypothetical protein
VDERVNEPPSGPEEDSRVPSEHTRRLAYAEASILLLESLMLILLQRRVLSPADLQDAIDAAVETKEHLAQEGRHPEIAEVAAGVLRRIGNSVAAGRKRPGW